MPAIFSRVNRRSPIDSVVNKRGEVFVSWPRANAECRSSRKRSRYEVCMSEDDFRILKAYSMSFAASSRRKWAVWSCEAIAAPKRSNITEAELA